MTKSYDIAIIGSGPGGYTAAIRAAQLGKSVALIEKLYIGGVCLNVGCIPTKSILTSADALDIIKKAEDFGLSVNDVKFDLEKIIKRKDQIVTNLRNGLTNLLKTNKINLISGKAKFLSSTELEITGKETIKISAKKIIIATGSLPQELKNVEVDHKLIFNSNSLLCLKKLPKSMIIIGGGYIGCEFASFYTRLGVKITMIEALPSILYSHGKEISDLLTTTFKRQGIEILTNVKVTGAEKTSNVKIKLEDGKVVESDIALVAIGRCVNTKGLDLEKANIKTGKKTEVIVNEKMQTSNPDIYAIGDVIGKWMLAHTASHEALVAVDTIVNKENKMDFSCVPAIIFTKPEIAIVGLTIEKAKEQNVDFEVGKFPFTALGKAHASSQKDGFVQVLIDKKTNNIIGAGAIGPSASVLIAEMALAITNKLNTNSIIETIHAHPTLPEAWLEATLISQNRPLNFPPNLKI